MSFVDDRVVNPSDLPKLVSRVSQCSTERSTELQRVGGIYIRWRVPGASGASTAGLLSALCFGLHSLVLLAAEGSHTGGGIQANTKSVHTSYLYRSVVRRYRGKTGWCSIVKNIYRTLLGRWFDVFGK